MLICLFPSPKWCLFPTHQNDAYFLHHLNDAYSPKWCLFPTHQNDAYFLLTKMMLISLPKWSPKWCLFPTHLNDAYFLIT